MCHPLQDAARASQTSITARLLVWLAGTLLAVLAASWLAPASVQAGTVTIVDGPDTEPVNGVYTDDYIQSYLAITGSLTISTTGVTNGPDDIDVEQSAVITWTTGNTLTLDAGANVVISGTIQHDGPATGEGGLHLLATAVPTGTVIIGQGTQTAGVVAGSRFGLTRVQARNLVLQGGGDPEAYAQLGYHAVDQGAAFSVTGAISVTVSQNLTATGGTAEYAFVQIGHGGADSAVTATPSGNFGGVIAVAAGGNVTFQAGSGEFAYAQLGNGGASANGNHSGSLALEITGSLTVTAGSGEDAYAMLGHGSDVRIISSNQSTGSRAGDLMVRVGETAVFSGSQVGHLTADGVLSVTQGNTFLGVSQNDPSFDTGPGQILVTGVTTSSFASAPTGELRFYLPRADSQQIPTSTTFNGSSFATDNIIPPDRLQGFFLFGDGPYSAPYSFYLGGRPDVAVTKTAVPAGPLRPGQVFTYTVSFSNTGTITATGVVISDTLPSVLTSTVPIQDLDAGVVITQTGGPPALAWEVSDLGPGEGGQLVLTATLTNTVLVLGTSFTNTAAITATGDISVSNNTASVSRDVVPAATLTITKTVVGAAPADVWQFSGSDGIGSFSLPAIGGTRVISGLIPTTYTISETVKSGYSVKVACTNGASGGDSVEVTLSPGITTGCTFTNEEQADFHLPVIRKNTEFGD